MKCVTPLVRIWNKGYPDDFQILPKSHVARQLAVNPNYLSINSFNSKIQNMNSKRYHVVNVMHVD